jgi:hypothetical protein
MKKVISIVAVLLLAAGIVIAQVPDNLKDKFNVLHPQASAIMWSTVDAGLYKVAYTESGTKHVIVYDKDMNSVWKRNEVATSEVPAPILDYFKTAYPEDKNYEVLVVDENGKTMYYSSKQDKKTVYLNREGKVVKTVYESKDYPKNIQAYYSQKYPEEKYTVYSEDEDGKVSYYTVRKGKIIYFDKEGNYLREDKYFDYDYNDAGK